MKTFEQYNRTITIIRRTKGVKGFINDLFAIPSYHLNNRLIYLQDNGYTTSISSKNVEVVEVIDNTNDAYIKQTQLRDKEAERNNNL